MEMNSLSIVLTYEFVSKRIRVTWRDVLYAIEQNFLSPKAAIEHAITKVCENEEFSGILI